MLNAISSLTVRLPYMAFIGDSEHLCEEQICRLEVVQNNIYDSVGLFKAIKL